MIVWGRSGPEFPLGIGTDFSPTAQPSHRRGRRSSPTGRA